ncbi:NAD(P)/FAD-dependent oxidoreductase [Mesorhizobium sp. M1E.F.Ca.ET.045.02.1.1]|uniref:dihydrolipoyl dehydrogenase family protein n=1 Tax=Mesorhizobium sp. M1E.F.Ca.ET.045.02.1.1 TaxID=2493672 RepID=UPI000F75CAA2|nr:NAD(P)/FAD-dependent oxidoreductase [Mesorhizobium sp. M1E.F.Ca.ET.045.02.1.1]AZO19823.1 NAD(P)/FAD-dependent oxidoreductase [Mesorhizobium sp. M1E.F.Ca.ET.045.02.1.1]
MTESNRSIPARTATNFDVLVIGAGPAGAMAALRAADLGARTALVTSAQFGGMAAHDGPVPVRTLARAARLISEARRLKEYGIEVGNPALDYQRLLARVREVVDDVVAHSSSREQLEMLGVSVIEHAGTVRFNDPHTVVTSAGLRLRADKIILCVGGVTRQLPVPGFELTSDHTSVFGATSAPDSMLVVGGGSTAVQIASIFCAFGSRVQVFEAGPRILANEDDDVSAAIAAAFRKVGVVVSQDFGAIVSFEKTPTGVRMNFAKGGKQSSAEAAIAVAAIGRAADTRGLNLSSAGVLLDGRGFVKVDDYLRTSTPHILAAGDVTGRLMVVPSAIRDGFVAATNALRGAGERASERIDVSASFTHPEYARAGLTEVEARREHDVLTSTVRFDSTMRTIIDGRKDGFCKLVVDRRTAKILGCHCVGELAGELAQTAAVAISAGMRVDELVRVQMAFPTYVGNLAYAAADAARQLELGVGNQHIGTRGDLYENLRQWDDRRKIVEVAV